MPTTIEGEKIATWTHTRGGETNEGLEFAYRWVEELYITPEGLKERRGLLYHPAGAPNNPVICDDHMRDVVELCELDGLIEKYSLLDEDAQRVKTALWGSLDKQKDSSPD